MLEDRDHTDLAANLAVRICVAVVFFLVGIEKFQSGSAQYWGHVFDAIGFGQWFRYFTGLVEIAGGLLFLVPPATFIGAALLASAMVGAMLTQAFVLHSPGSSLFPALYLAVIIAAFMKLRRVHATSVRRDRSVT